MAKFIFDGLTPIQAAIFADWYSGQGEQDADIWFHCKHCPTPMTDDRKTHIDKNGDVTIYCRNS